MHDGQENTGSRTAGSVRLTVIAPAHNEAENLPILIEQVGDACGSAGVAFEFIIVDDASTDGTVNLVSAMIAERPWLRLLSLPAPKAGGGNGQSAAFRAGIEASNGALIATLDADLQNDPGDLVPMLERLESSQADFVQGDRSASRHAGDAWIRQVGSGVGRAFRRMILGDPTRDTGCSLRIMKREIAIRLPLEFKGTHRFIPIAARQMGFAVMEMPVTHRPRHAGESKYGLGIVSRAIPGLIDCFAVRWMGSRRRMPGVPVEQPGWAVDA